MRYHLLCVCVCVRTCHQMITHPFQFGFYYFYLYISIVCVFSHFISIYFFDVIAVFVCSFAHFQSAFIHMICRCSFLLVCVTGLSSCHLSKCVIYIYFFLIIFFFLFFCFIFISHLKYCIRLEVFVHFSCLLISLLTKCTTTVSIKSVVFVLKCQKKISVLSLNVLSHNYHHRFDVARANIFKSKSDICGHI